jgi:hypothetical protein
MRQSYDAKFKLMMINHAEKTKAAMQQDGSGLWKQICEGEGNKGKS